MNVLILSVVCFSVLSLSRISLSYSLSLSFSIAPSLRSFLFLSFSSSPPSFPSLFYFCLHLYLSFSPFSSSSLQLHPLLLPPSSLSPFLPLHLPLPSPFLPLPLSYLLLSLSPFSFSPSVPFPSLISPHLPLSSPFSPSPSPSPPSPS